MPEYLAPGVFVEEISFRQKTIEGVSTSTTGFVGPTLFGPVDGEPPLLTSFAEFDRIYGGLDDLQFKGARVPNYLAHAVRAYFNEGGRRLYVARVHALQVPEEFTDRQARQQGLARWPEEDASPDRDFTLWARHPGRGGHASVQFVFQLGENALRTDSEGQLVLRGVQAHDIVVARRTASPDEPELFHVNRVVAGGRTQFTLDRPGSPGESPEGREDVPLEELSEVRVLTVQVRWQRSVGHGEELVWDGLSCDPAHRNALGTVFAARPDRGGTVLYTPLVFDTELTDGVAIAEALLDEEPFDRDSPAMTTLFDSITSPGDRSEDQRKMVVALSSNALDGDAPSPEDYAGPGAQKRGFRALEDVEDISIVAAPGSTHEGASATARAIMGHMIGHCERMRYRIAVLDSVQNSTLGEVRDLRAEIDSTHAALYYPWVTVSDPNSSTGQELTLPPSGFVAGIYARNDVDRGVHKAPANEVIRTAIGLETSINRGQQEALNPEGVNCLRFFEGRGFRVWGARTATSDPEWKYVNLRRYFAFLERSIEKGTQFAVFEPNGPLLWANVQRTIEDFLYNEFLSNHLLGRKPQQAFFVRCDESTMSQNDLDNGRLVCLVGVAPLRPAEFVIFRIGQKTVDARG